MTALEVQKTKDQKMNTGIICTLEKKDFFWVIINRCKVKVEETTVSLSDWRKTW